MPPDVPYGPAPALQLVFHGTDAANIHLICKDGLDPARRNGQAHGPGEYFGASMQVSAGYNRSSPYMLIFAVLLDRSGLTKADTQMVVVNKAEHQLPLAVVTLRGAAYAPPPGWLGSVSNPHETERAALAPAAKQAAQHAQLAAQYAQHLAAGRAHPSSWGLPPNAWSMAAAAGGVGLAALAALQAAAASPGSLWPGPLGRGAPPPPAPPPPGPAWAGGSSGGNSAGKRRKRS